VTTRLEMGNSLTLYLQCRKKLFVLFNEKKTITEEMKYVILLGSNRLASYLENSSFVSKSLSSKCNYKYIIVSRDLCLRKSSANKS
jgi:hypothetical protein